MHLKSNRTTQVHKQCTQYNQTGNPRTANKAEGKGSSDYQDRRKKQSLEVRGNMYLQNNTTPSGMLSQECNKKKGDHSVQVCQKQPMPSETLECRENNTVSGAQGSAQLTSKSTQEVHPKNRQSNAQAGNAAEEEHVQNIRKIETQNRRDRRGSKVGVTLYGVVGSRHKSSHSTIAPECSTQGSFNIHNALSEMHASPIHNTFIYSQQSLQKPLQLHRANRSKATAGACFRHGPKQH